MKSLGIKLALFIIKAFESYSSAPYYDETGKVWTVGYGRTGPDVTEYSYTTREREDKWLKEHVTKLYESLYEKHSRKTISAFQMAAITSLVYNIGEGRYYNSNTFKEINKGNTLKAVKEWKEFRMSGGKVLNGLVIRRTVETTIYMLSVFTLWLLIALAAILFYAIYLLTKKPKFNVRSNRVNVRKKPIKKRGSHGSLWSKGRVQYS